jgi:hypothetical protein
VIFLICDFFKYFLNTWQLITWDIMRQCSSRIFMQVTSHYTGKDVSHILFLWKSLKPGFRFWYDKVHCSFHMNLTNSGWLRQTLHQASFSRNSGMRCTDLTHRSTYWTLGWRLHCSQSTSVVTWTFTPHRIEYTKLKIIGD